MVKRTSDNQEKLRKILDELKEEIFVELDRRITETEGSLGEQITEINDQIGDQVQGEVQKHVKRMDKRFGKRFKSDFKKFQDNLQIYHKIPYAIMVFAGVVLFWYGSWAIIREIPFLNNGIVALSIGGVLLLLTGTIYKKLTS